MFGILRTPPFVNPLDLRKGKDVNSDWLADQWDKRSVFGHAQFHKEKIKGDDPEIDTAQTPKHFHGRLAPLEKIRKTFTDSIPNKTPLNETFKGSLKSQTNALSYSNDFYVLLARVSPFLGKRKCHPCEHSNIIPGDFIPLEYNMC